MNTTRSTRLLLLLASGAVSLSSAQAANLVQIDGQHATFFYDADFWGLGAASVQGDAITLQVRPDFAVAASVRTGTTTANQLQQAFDFASPGVVAVAKSGYNLQTLVGSSLSGNYALAAGGSQVNVTLSGSLLLGEMDHGVFVPQSGFTGYTTEADFTSSGAARSAPFNALMYTGNILPYVSTLGVESYLSTYVRQVGSGTSALSLDTVAYQFATVAIPEPHTYALLLGGLSLMRWARKRNF
ncbi:hypothetical protein [Duganella callida]|uniref:PEP-CTERM sorting domain-containing protein n=1 Tax=Duganella callida TaxID=2561932 RepID=A0A4Y9S4M3_9BURK|nr:hypothetical protein [Duganella callida]TFW14805.1 hypothetical protein E4L98_27725 [Duganella callida]